MWDRLHRAPARPSFSIMAVPHMVLYDCPSSCPTAEHMLVASILSWGEKRFYCVFQIQIEVCNIHLKKNTLFDVDRVKKMASFTLLCSEADD